MSSDLSAKLPLSCGHGSSHSGLNALGWIALVAAAIILAVLIYSSTAAHTPPAQTADLAAGTADHTAGTAAHASGHDADTAGHAAAGAHSEEHDAHAMPEGYRLPPIWACAPFVALLLCIAVLPLIPSVAHWWEHNINRLLIALVLGAVTLGYYAFVHPMTVNHETHATYTGLQSVLHVLNHAVLGEYIPFIVLLFSLYVISGGISLRGDLVAKPTTNAAFLAVGGALASFIGTTGASMLLIRPLLQTNSERRNVRHTVIFFIFLVSNCGGLLLPIGDPPLFLGYLRGVPFLWTLSLVPEWLMVGVSLLVIYFVWDTLAYRKEKPADIAKDNTQRRPLRVRGTINMFWLVGVVLCVALVKPGEEFLGLGFKPFPFMRELMQLGFVALSLKTTSKQIRKDNEFNYHAILEVAALFIGIFICMQVPIEILHGSGEYLAKVINQPTHFFWATGGLSSFLDNAPTYVVFFTTAETMTPGASEHALALVDGGHIQQTWLVAISLGAVFMGAMTYIGNGPNFMVKSIAEESGVKMPSFFGYMLYSVAILIPLFILVNIIFL